MANWNMKRYSELLNIWEPQIKTAMKYHLKPVRMPIIKKTEIIDVGKNVEEEIKKMWQEYTELCKKELHD